MTALIDTQDLETIARYICELCSKVFQGVDHTEKANFDFITGQTRGGRDYLNNQFHNRSLFYQNVLHKGPKPAKQQNTVESANILVKVLNSLLAMLKSSNTAEAKQTHRFQPHM